jgi:4-amino-4-deoxy-L-arabinose transferase-like glycosyltransferase
MMPDDHARGPDRAVVLIVLLSLPLFVYGLGSTYLWQDEAQTALLGRSVLRHGVPMVGTGTDSLSAHTGEDAGLHGIYFQISWLQAYVVATSFRLFGESSWAARVPFALAGWLCVPLVAWVVIRAGGTRHAARIAALLTATNIAFLICSRQARYYGLTAALALLAVGTYTRVLQRDAIGQPIRASSVGLAVAATLLVLSFDVTAMGMLGVMAVHWILVGRSRRSLQFWSAWLLAATVLIAWIALSSSAPIRHSNVGLAAMLNRLWYGPFYYAGQIDAHVVPLPLLALAALAFRERTRPAAMLLSAVAVGASVGVMLSPYRFFRYIVPAVPFVFGLVGLGLAAVAEKGRAARIVSYAIVALLAFSTAFHSFSRSLLAAVADRTDAITVRRRSVPIRIPLADLLQEFRDPPRGPVSAAIAFFGRHAKPTDIVVTAYGELPLKFHTSLRVYGGETGQLPKDGERATWIWPRHLKPYGTLRASVEWIEHELSRGKYERIELDAIDRRWENREDPVEHIFTNPGPPGPRMVIYKAME